jgi:hypothetical protein
MKKIIKSRIPTAIIFALCSIIGIIAFADQESIPFVSQSGGTGSGCSGAYTGYAKYTNSSGFWITPPAGTSSGTLTDTSGFTSNYVSVAKVGCNNLSSWCDTNSVTFPATNSRQYTLTIFVKSTPPPPTNGQPLTLQITWK